MASTGDVTVAEGEGQGNVKIHPYLLTMMRWCMSCVWSTATVLLHRLMRAQVPQIAAPKPVRSTGTDHLHPEPKVECVILHEPPTPNLDVIFVHGLYGSLSNTWRQGDWRTKYKIDPNVVQLRSHPSKRTCDCHKLETKAEMKATDSDNESKCKVTYDTVHLNESTYDDINERLKMILPNENSLITEKFYNDIMINDGGNVSQNYKTQAKFVQDLFDKSKMYDGNVNKCNNDNECKIRNECKCRVNESVGCEVGCGCVCEDCYSTCWPKDWIKMDFPGARVISINYTSDPYLWRPLWVKGNARLRLHERAEQMMAQLLVLGVGKRPIVWVGHSKGGLFIKQIYCEAFETHLKLSKINGKNIVNCNHNKSSIIDSDKHTNSHENIDDYNNEIINHRTMNVTNRPQDEVLLNINNRDESDYRINISNNNDVKRNTYLLNGALNKYDLAINKDGTFNKTLDIIAIDDNSDSEFEEHDESKMVYRNLVAGQNILRDDTTVNVEELDLLKNKASLWRYSAGFMFYSVPHRGSPLADIKTPITSRSIELLEISKDCPLVLSLQDRWLMASSPSKPAVRSLVETCRTLMSVLWLRIVSVDSADAGIGELCGVSVDHREICKPSSRSCLLYTQLTDLIHIALNKCQCH